MKMKMIPRAAVLSLSFVLGCAGAALAAAPATPYAHYQADAGVTVQAETGIVTEWANQATGGTGFALDRVLGSPATTTLERSGGGTGSVLAFDGTSALWAARDDWGATEGNRSVVVYARAMNGDDGFLFDGSTSSGKTRAQVRSGSWQVGVQANAADFGSADPVTGAVTSNTWQTHIFTYAESGGNTQVTHYTDGALIGTHSVAADTTLRGFILASNGGSPFQYLDSQVAELLVYDRELTSTERTDVTTYLDGRWGDLIDTPLVYQSATVVQDPQEVFKAGVHGVAALQLTSVGNVSGYNLTQLEYHLDGTSDLNDIEEVRLYSSGSTTTLSPNADTLIATATGPFTGTLTFDVVAPVTDAVNYFWVAVKLKGTSANGDHVDAGITGFTIDGPSAGSYVPTVTEPAGYLTVGSGYFSTVVRARGDDGVHTYRIPGLATSNAGTLIAVYDIRNDGGGDLPGNIDVGVSRSTDGGFTWGPMIVCMDYDKNVAGSDGNGVGDPAVMVDRVTGRIWCAALWSKGNNGWAGSGLGMTPDETGQYVLNYSDDDGLTWSPPVSITSQIKDPAWRLYFQGPGKGFTLRDGTLIFPSQFKDASNNPHSNFIYSTDRGATWNHAPPAVPASSPWTTEAQMVELDNGDLLISMRNHAGVGQRAWAIYSWDHETETIADGAWMDKDGVAGQIWYDQTDPTCMASVIRYRSTLDGHPFSALVFANPDNGSRSKMSIRISLDEGKTWPYKRKIDDRPAAYSCMTLMPDGDIGIFYETGDSGAYAGMEFARFPLSWVVGNTDTDADGIPDFHEDVMGLNKNDTSDGVKDDDGDGATNLEEYEAQTDPKTKDSVLSAEVVQQGDGFALTWQSVEFVNYRVETSPTMASGSWSAVRGFESVQATGAMTSVTLPAGTDPRGFYRVVTQ